MDRLTTKLKKGGYSAKGHTQEELAERLEQFKGVYQEWLSSVDEMVAGMKQSQEVGPEGSLSVAMLQMGYNSIVRIGRRFEAACPVTTIDESPLDSVGKLEDLYELCVLEEDDIREGLDECRENNYSDSLAYNELLISKLSVSELIKKFDIATGFAEPDEAPYTYAPKD